MALTFLHLQKGLHNLFVLFIIIHLTCSTTAAQNPTPTDTTTQSPKPPDGKSPSGAQPNLSPSPAPIDDEIRVIDVYKAGHADKNDEERNRAGINDDLVIKVVGFNKLLNKSRCLDTTNKKIANCTTQEICLFLDGQVIKGIYPKSGAPEKLPGKDQGEFRFKLERIYEKNDAAWADLLGSPTPFREFFCRSTRVSVGIENEFAQVSDVEKFEIVRIRTWQFWISVAIMIVLLIIFYRYAKKSTLLRDAWPKASNTSPYSLARFQMAYWFIIVVVSFLFIWLITGAYDIITASVLGLIGIGAGTGVSAAVIDTNKIEELQTQLTNFKAEQQTVNDQLIASPGSAALQNQLNIINLKITEINTQLNPLQSEGFMKDILSDQNGISFHRYQMFAWTIVLGLIFIYSVWARLAMPDFGGTLLALLGISAGTYLGFKIPEKRV